MISNSAVMSRLSVTVVLATSLAACASSKTSLGVSSECSSPIPYEDKSISLNAAYGLIGLGGSYESRAPKGIEKSLHIYYDQASFLCEEHRAKRLSDKDYADQRRALALQFAGVVDVSKRSVSQGGDFDAKDLTRFSESSGIQFSSASSSPPWQQEETATPMFIIGHGISVARGPWADQLLACLTVSLGQVSDILGSNVKGEMILNKGDTALDETFSAKSTLSWQHNPSIRVEQETKSRAIVSRTATGEKQINKIRQSVVLSAPSGTLANSPVTHRAETYEGETDSWSNSAWDKAPAADADQLASLLKLLSKEGVKLTHAQIIPGDEPVLVCRVLLDIDQAKERGLKGIQ